MHISSKSNLLELNSKIIKCFEKNYSPYVIGYISKNHERLKLYNKLKWQK